MESGYERKRNIYDIHMLYKRDLIWKTLFIEHRIILPKTSQNHPT